MNMEFKSLDQFKERKCEVSFHSLLDEGLSASYAYECFDYDYDCKNENETFIILKDIARKDSWTTFKIDNIVGINSISDDIYIIAKNTPTSKRSESGR